MKKMQISLPERTAKQVDEVIKNEGFESESEFGRFLIQDYLIRRQYGLLDTVKSNLDYAQTQTLTENFDVFAGGADIERDMVSGLSGGD